MATVNFSVPEALKKTFNQAFAGANNSAIVAQLMREAVEARRREERRRAIEEFAPASSTDEARDPGRQPRGTGEGTPVIEVALDAYREIGIGPDGDNALTLGLSTSRG